MPTPPPTRSDIARALSSFRPKITITCQVCGKSREVVARATQPPRTCSTRCRVALHRAEKAERESAPAALGRERGGG